MPPMVPVSVVHVDGVEIPKPRGFKEVLPALGVATIASFGGFLFGFDSGVISGILEMEKFKEDYGNYYSYNIPGNLISSSNPPKPGWSISTSDRSLIVSILSVGTFFGALSAAPMADLMGRRVALQIAILIFVGGVILQCASTAVPLYAIGRLIAGLGVGAISLTVPLYQSEVSPAWIRGSLVSCYQWMITIGLLIASIVTNSTQNRKDKGSYIIPIAVQFMFALIISTGLLFLPDSPRWFVKRDQDEKAAKVIAKLNSLTVEAPYVQAELKAIKMDLEKEKKEGGGNYIDLFKKGDYKVSTRVIVGMASQALQQLTGINFIFYYGVTFFKMTGAKNPFVFAIISNVVNVVSTIPGMYMMERLGRRKLFIGGAIWMFIAQIIVASVGTAYDVSNRPAQAAAVAFVCIYIAGFAATWGPVVWVWTSEAYPLNVRAKALSLSTASNWIWNWAIGYATPYLVDSGPGRAGLGPRVYFIWAGGCLICIFFSYFFIVETRGLTLEEVNDVYINSTPINSTKYNSEIKARRTESEMITNKVSNTNDENDFDLENGHGKHEKQKEVEEEEIETPKIEENLKSSP